jgi:hypothetical protein
MGFKKIHYLENICLLFIIGCILFTFFRVHHSFDGLFDESIFFIVGYFLLLFFSVYSIGLLVSVFGEYFTKISKLKEPE